MMYRWNQYLEMNWNLVSRVGAGMHRVSMGFAMCCLEFHSVNMARMVRYE